MNDDFENLPRWLRWAGLIVSIPVTLAVLKYTGNPGFGVLAFIGATFIANLTILRLHRGNR